MSEFRIINEIPSETARAVAYLRAIGNLEENSAFACQDSFAQFFLNDQERLALKKMQFDAVKRYWISNHSLPGAYEYLVARTKLFDSVLLAAIDDGIEQVVVLGAGYDSRALRFGQDSKAPVFYELDALQTQQRKQEALKTTGSNYERLPHFLPIDFNRQNTREVLLLSNFDRNKRTLFLWEGVSMYLDADAVRDLLTELQNLCKKPALCIFDYVYAEALSGEKDYYGAKESLAFVRSQGEPYTFGINNGLIREFLTQLGFDLVEHYDDEKLVGHFLSDQFGNILGRPHGFFAVALARTKPEGCV